jgi:hypothetical protein
MNIGCMMSLLRQVAASLAGKASLLSPGIRPSVTAGWTGDDVVGISENAGYGQGLSGPREPDRAHGAAAPRRTSVQRCPGPWSWWRNVLEYARTDQPGRMVARAGRGIPTARARGRCPR